VLLELPVVGVVVVESDSDEVVADFLWCFFCVEELWSPVVLSDVLVESLPVLLVVFVLPFIEPALELLCAGCVLLVVEELVDELVVEELEAPGIELFCWSVLLLDCARAIAAPSNTSATVYRNFFISRIS